jgi:protein involved in polysaccharide export with SLBB domain
MKANTEKLLLSMLATLLVAATAVHAQEAVMRPGDSFELRLGGVTLSDEIMQVSGTYTVDGEGYINMPYIGKVMAARATQSQLQSSIESTYRSRGIFTNPSITLTVPDTARFVNTGGEVKMPQRVPFTADLTVLGAISASGGFTDFADQGKVRLLRDGKARIVNIKEIRKDPSKDIKLRPGDKIEVPQSFW